MIVGIVRQQMKAQQSFATRQTIASKNKALVLEAFDTLFNKRDYATAERFGWPLQFRQEQCVDPEVRKPERS
jgi:hypothetical protein